MVSVGGRETDYTYIELASFVKTWGLTNREFMKLVFNKTLAGPTVKMRDTIEFAWKPQVSMKTSSLIRSWKTGSGQERGNQKEICTGIGWKKEEGKGEIRKGKEAGEEGKER